MPAEPAPLEMKTPDLWEYLREIEQKHEWTKHTIYVYRRVPGPQIPVQKVYDGFFSLPDGQRVPIQDREEMEFALLKHFGGREFFFMVKRGSMIITTGSLFVDAPPRQVPVLVESGPAAPAMAPTAFAQLSDASATAQVAGRAMDALTMQERTSAEIGFRAMETAANVMQKFADPNRSQPVASSETDQMMRMLMLKMMEKLIDKLDTPVASPNALTEKLLGVAVDRMLNPAPSGAPVSASAELVRALPQLGGNVAESLREFRLAREAELQIIQAQQRGASVRPIAPNPQVIPPAAPVNGPAQQPAANGAPTMEFIESKIMEIMRQPISATQAADDALTFLDATDERIAEELCKLGETGLVQLFQRRPLLMPATGNMPRLIEFIRTFIKMHSEDLAQAAAEAVTPAAKPPLAN